MAEHSDARDIIDAVQTLTAPTVLDPDSHYAFPVAGDGSVVFSEPVEEKHLPAPRRPRGTTVTYDVDSLAVMWAKFAFGGSELFGDPNRHVFTGVLNADQSQGTAGFRDHRVELPLQKSLAWQKWTAINGDMLSQVEFAEFLEARLVDVVRPTGADMLELATTLEASSSVEFKSAVSLASGVRQFAFEETQTTRAGQTGSLEIPKEIELGIAPFEGGEPFRVTARFRYRIRNGSLTLGVVLDQPEEVVRAAFSDFAERVAVACSATVLLGTPPQPTLACR